VEPSGAEIVVTGPDQPPLGSEDAAVVVLGPDDPETMIRAVDGGAMGYVVAGSALVEVARAAQSVADGEAVIPPLMLGALLKHVVRRRRAEKAELDRLASLTDREREVFDLLAAGLDRSLIAERLYISVGTVRSHLQRVFRKLDVHTHAEAVAFAARCGLRTEDPGGPP
jgi:DNA-binding NarL/FixJ family response regulator